MLSNIGIEKLPRHYGHRAIKPKPTNARVRFNDLNETGDLLRLEWMAVAMLQAKQTLNAHGIGSVVVSGQKVIDGALFITLRYFTPLDILQQQAISRTTPDGRATDFYLPFAENGAIHWRKHHSQNEG